MELVEIETSGLTAAGRYELLHRVGRLIRDDDVRWLAFDVRASLRLLFSGPSQRIATLARSVKSGTVQAQRSRGRSDFWMGETLLRAVFDPAEAVVELHRDAAQGSDPLDTPWSSHRDLLGYRASTYFDPTHVLTLLDPRWVHLRAGGGDLPRRPEEVSHGRDLDLPLRVSAAVLGVLPADPKSFRLYAHLARRLGRRQVDIAASLMLTDRRIRQLQAQPEPRLGMAMTALSDPRLQRVP